MDVHVDIIFPADGTFYFAGRERANYTPLRTHSSRASRTRCANPSSYAMRRYYPDGCQSPRAAPLGSAMTLSQP